MKRYAALLVLPLLAACGSSGDGSESASNSTTVTETATQSTSTQSVAPSTVTSQEDDSLILGAPDLEDKFAEVTEYESVITDIRVGHHDGFDRIVFDIAGPGIPGWEATYSETPTAQGSGLPIEYEGNVALTLRVTGLLMPFELGQDVEEAIGSFPGAGNVTGVEAIGVFEGQGQYIIGLDQERPYSIQILEEPTRLVIDIAG